VSRLVINETFITRAFRPTDIITGQQYIRIFLRDDKGLHSRVMKLRNHMKDLRENIPLLLSSNPLLTGLEITFKVDDNDKLLSDVVTAIENLRHLRMLDYDGNLPI
jgi:hypothetical protein